MASRDAELDPQVLAQSWEMGLQICQGKYAALSKLGLECAVCALGMLPLINSIQLQWLLVLEKGPETRRVAARVMQLFSADISWPMLAITFAGSCASSKDNGSKVATLVISMADDEVVSDRVSV